MNINPQPSNDELRRALFWFLMADSKDCDEQKLLLAQLRDKRTTWFDTEELALRRSIDEVLET